MNDGASSVGGYVDRVQECMGKMTKIARRAERKKEHVVQRVEGAV